MFKADILDSITRNNKPLFSCPLLTRALQVLEKYNFIDVTMKGSYKYYTVKEKEGKSYTFNSLIFSKVLDKQITTEELRLYIYKEYLEQTKETVNTNLLVEHLAVKEDKLIKQLNKISLYHK